MSKTLSQPGPGRNGSGPSALLGTNTNLPNPPSVDPSFSRLNRWALQAAAREALKSITRTDKVNRTQRKFRVTFCCRNVRQNENAQLKRRVDRRPVSAAGHNFTESVKGGHHYSGIMQCGSVWTCPVCGSKISERRRVELLAGIEAWEAQGGAVIMLTQTVPHYKNDSLQSVLDPFKAARELQRNRKPWNKWAAQYLVKPPGKNKGYGIITASEPTYGENGWHVHTHEILFLKPNWVEDHEAFKRNNPLLYQAHFKAINFAKKHGKRPPKDPFLQIHMRRLFPTWENAVVDSGLRRPSDRHGLDLSDKSEVARYVTKWGIDHEVTKAHIKEGRNGGRTPWAILSDFLTGGDLEDQDLFREFAEAFHGSQQLRWSRGLKDHLGIEEKEDEQLLDEAEQGDHVLTFSLSQWRMILKYDVRGQVLEIANMGGKAAVLDYLGELTLKDIDGRTEQGDLQYVQKRKRSISVISEEANNTGSRNQGICNVHKVEDQKAQG